MERARRDRRESVVEGPRERWGVKVQGALRALRDARAHRGSKDSPGDLREREALRRLRALTLSKASPWGSGNWRVLQVLPGARARKAREVREGPRARKAGKARRDPEALRAPGAKRARKVGKGRRELRVLKARQDRGAAPRT